MAQFAYNNSVNRSIGMSPFEVVSGYKPRTPIDLIPLTAAQRPSDLADAFAHHIHALHKDIRKKLITSYETYKWAADLHRRDVEYQVGDFVTVRIKPERFP